MENKNSNSFDNVASKLNDEAKSYLEPSLIDSLKKSYKIHNDLKNHFISSENNHHNNYIQRLSSKYNIKANKSIEKKNNIAFLFKLVLRNNKVSEIIGN